MNQKVGVYSINHEQSHFYYLCWLLCMLQVIIFKEKRYIKVLNMDMYLCFLHFVLMVAAISQILLYNDHILYFGDYCKVGHVFI